MSTHIPFDIVANICRYVPQKNFINTLVINKDIYLKLKTEIFIRRNCCIINAMINETRCLSNINLGVTDGGFYRCRSKRDKIHGSVFCNFCNFIKDKSEARPIY